MTKPLVSIITPLYNHEKFIGTCIKSVLNQTYENWEQIIVDDSSTDGSLNVALSFSKKDKRIKIIHHIKNWGIGRLADNYNQALKMAKGEYIAILESDDFWPKQKLEKQIQFMKKRKAVLSFGNCILTGTSGIPINLFTYNGNKNQLSNNPSGSILRLFANLKFAIIPVTVIIRKKELIEIGGFKKDKFYPFCDIPTFLNLALTGKFAYMNEILGYYRKQTISEWYGFASKTSAMGREEIRDCTFSFLRRHKKNETILKILNEDKLANAQNKFIEEKRRWKKLSIFLNTTAFRFNLNPLFFIFCVKYIFYNLKKINENRN